MGEAMRVRLRAREGTTGFEESVAEFAAQPEGYAQEEFTGYPLEIDGAAAAAEAPVSPTRGERGADGRAGQS